MNRQSKWILWLILLMALSLRLGWLVTHSQTANIGGEGSEYARLADNLRTGNGYVGIFNLGPQLMFPPLYPVLIASFSLITGEAELAGRLVSLIMGTCLVVPVFFMALQIYGRRTAFIAASLVAAHPVLVKLSAEVYSEALYLTLLMSGVYWSLRSLEFENLRNNVLAGAFFALAYLTRPEAIAYPFLVGMTIFAVAVMSRLKPKQVVRCLARMAVPFVLLAAPYVGYLSIQTGQIRLEGKSDINYLIGRRMNSGMNYGQAAYGIDETLTEQGPFLMGNLTAIRSVGNRSLREVAQYLVSAAKRNGKVLFQILSTSRSFGSPILIVLATLCFFRKTWSHKRLIQEGLLLVIVSSIFLILLSVQHFWQRYAFPFLPFLILWASNGIAEISEWAEDTTRSISCMRLGRSKLIRIASQCAVSTMLLVFATSGMAEEVGMFHGGKSHIKEAGLWLRNYLPGPKTVMDVGGVIPYYAGGSWVALPYAESSLALKYIAYKRPQFIVLSRGGSGITPYMDEWIGNGIPDKNAKLIYSTGTTPQEKIMIFQLDTSSDGQ